MKDKLRIGILSFPTACNHGAYLQVYALRSYLLNQNYNVEVINYRNKQHFLNEMRSMFIKKNVKLISFNIIRYLGFRRAQKRFDMDRMTFSHHHIRSDSYDVIIIGGDIVWEFKSPFIGHDPIYYGHGLSSQKVISYAASSGNAKVSDAPLYVKNGIELFSAIGVRDSESLKIAKVVKSDIEKTIVLDTTLIYDFEETENTNKGKSYILVYAFTVTDIDITQLKEFAREHDLDIISVTFNKSHSWASKNLFSIDPLYFVSLLEHAKYVYTSTFHGLLFAIKYKKQVALRNNSTIQAKCSWLIERLALEGVLISENREISSIYNDSNLYGGYFDESFAALKAESISFLNRSIGGQ